MRRVSSTAHVVVLGQSAGSVRGRTMDDQGVCFLYAIHAPPPAWVREVGMRASGKPSEGDGAFAGWKCMPYPLLLRTCFRARLRMCNGVSVRKRISGEWSSITWMMSAIEGLFAPTFWVLSVRRVRSVAAFVIVAVGSTGSVGGPARCAVVLLSMVGVLLGEAPARSTPSIEGVSVE